MTPIEILATIFAVLVLVKIAICAVNPKHWMRWARAALKESALAMVAYLILAAIVGYYVLTSMSIVQVAAVMLLTGILAALAFIPYSEALLKMGEDIVEKGVLYKSWKVGIIVSIWVALAIWVLYAVFG